MNQREEKGGLEDLDYEATSPEDVECEKKLQQRTEELQLLISIQDDPNQFLADCLAAGDLLTATILVNNGMVKFEDRNHEKELLGIWSQSDLWASDVPGSVESQKSMLYELLRVSGIIGEKNSQLCPDTVHRLFVHNLCGARLGGACPSCTSLSEDGELYFFPFPEVMLPDFEEKSPVEKSNNKDHEIEKSIHTNGSQEAKVALEKNYVRLSMDKKCPSEQYARDARNIWVCALVDEANWTYYADGRVSLCIESLSLEIVAPSTKTLLHHVADEVLDALVSDSF